MTKQHWQRVGIPLVAQKRNRKRVPEAVQPLRYKKSAIRADGALECLAFALLGRWDLNLTDPNRVMWLVNLGRHGPLLLGSRAMGGRTYRVRCGCLRPPMFSRSMGYSLERRI